MEWKKRKNLTDEFYMQLAINQAWKYQLLTYPNPAVGAVVVRDGEILAIEAHQKAGTSHAEVLALVGAYEAISGKRVTFDRFDAYAAHEFLHSLPDGFFGECEIYVTLEPCSHEGKTPSCANLLQGLELKRVVIGINDPIKGHDGGVDILRQSIDASNIKVGVLQEECGALIEPFLIWQERAFVLFKLAQTANGRIGGGTISCEASRKHMHHIRSLATRLLIGGNTVRTDRPTLDARLVGGRAPDVTIYTNHFGMDFTIPLFRVPDRSVNMLNYINAEKLPRGIVMVEGGEGMLKVMRHQMDWMLIYQAPKLSTNEISYNIDINLEILHSEKKDVDLMIWSKNLGH